MRSARGERGFRARILFWAQFGPIAGPMDAISERLHQSLTLGAQRGAAELGEEACSRQVVPQRLPSTAALPPPLPRTHAAHCGPALAPKRSFVRPGGVASAWARCVGVQRTVNVRKRATSEPEGGEGGAAVLTGNHVSGLADMAAFLRQRKRCVPTPAAVVRGIFLSPGSLTTTRSLPRQAYCDGGSQADGAAPGAPAGRGAELGEPAHRRPGASDAATAAHGTRV